MNTLAKVQVDLGDRTYPILVGQKMLPDFGQLLKDQFPNHKFALITQPGIAQKWVRPIMEAWAPHGIEPLVFEMGDGEEAKNLQTVSNIYDFLIEHRFGRQTVIIALGGGVVGDVAGFAAASFLRGVELVQLPTSLLAMVDSSVGGKTGVNHRLGKNLIGAFKQPRLVGIELDFLATLPDEEFHSGLAEIIKYGVIADASLFEFLESHVDDIFDSRVESLAHIITRSCEIKAMVVTEDEFENGVRAILNFGHTFGHAVETLTEYKKFRHGEAVAMGMISACRLGEQVQDFPQAATERLINLVKAMGLPVKLPEFSAEEYLHVMRHDKKVKSGRMRLVVPVSIGEVVVRDDVDEMSVVRAIAESF